jgi:hypothetical protein
MMAKSIRTTGKSSENQKAAPKGAFSVRTRAVSLKRYPDTRRILRVGSMELGRLASFFGNCAPGARWARQVAAPDHSTGIQGRRLDFGGCILCRDGQRRRLPGRSILPSGLLKNYGDGATPSLFTGSILENPPGCLEGRLGGCHRFFFCIPSTSEGWLP